MIYLDTHVVAWLYQGDLQQLPNNVLQLIDNHDIRISPMVQLELQYLYEIKRATEPAHRVIQHLQAALGLSICNTSFEQIIDYATTVTWTRDPFDRIIVSQAALNNTSLVTKDKILQQHYEFAIWE